VTAIGVLVFEAAAEIAAPGRKRRTPTCTGPEAAHAECGWKRGERRKTENTTVAESKDIVVQPGTLRMERAFPKPF